MHNERRHGAWEQSLLRKNSTAQVLISSPVLSVILLVHMQLAPGLCSGHVLCRCSAMIGATGCSLGLYVASWPTGLVDNLHPTAIECDSAEVSTGLWIKSVGR